MRPSGRAGRCAPSRTRGSIPRGRDHGGGDHPVPFRTRQLSPPSPRVLRCSPWEGRESRPQGMLFALRGRARGPPILFLTLLAFSASRLSFRLCSWARLPQLLSVPKCLLCVHLFRQGFIRFFIVLNRVYFHFRVKYIRLRTMVLLQDLVKWFDAMARFGVMFWRQATVNLGPCWTMCAFDYGLLMQIIPLSTSCREIWHARKQRGHVPPCSSFCSHRRW